MESPTPQPLLRHFSTIPDPRIERRYSISSLAADAKEVGKARRGHGTIEKQLHRVLDVSFREDKNRRRTVPAAKNLATLRPIVLHLLKQEKSVRVGIKSKRLKAGWDDDHQLNVLRN